jgi:predicted N-acetyltransferase YhbS
MDVVISEETKNDETRVREINNEAFEQECEGKLVDALHKNENFIPQLSLVAKVDGRIEGYILFTKIYIESDSGRRVSLALAPVSVAKKFQNNGIGKQLVQKGIEKAKELGFDSIIVLGHPSYYPQFGFLPASIW